METIEKGMTRRQTFFCTNRDKHTRFSKVINVESKSITVFGKRIDGWLITTEEPAIDKYIVLDETVVGDMRSHDPE